MGEHPEAHEAKLPLIRAVNLNVNGGHYLAAPGCHHDGDMLPLRYVPYQLGLDWTS